MLTSKNSGTKLKERRAIARTQKKYPSTHLQVEVKGIIIHK